MLIIKEHDLSSLVINYGMGCISHKYRKWGLFLAVYIGSVWKPFKLAKSARLSIMQCTLWKAYFLDKTDTRVPFKPYYLTNLATTLKFPRATLALITASDMTPESHYIACNYWIIRVNYISSLLYFSWNILAVFEYFAWHSKKIALYVWRKDNCLHGLLYCYWWYKFCLAKIQSYIL